MIHSLFVLAMAISMVLAKDGSLLPGLGPYKKRYLTTETKQCSADYMEKDAIDDPNKWYTRTFYDVSGEGPGVITIPVPIRMKSDAPTNCYIDTCTLTLTKEDGFESQTDYTPGYNSNYGLTAVGLGEAKQHFIWMSILVVNGYDRYTKVVCKPNQIDSETPIEFKSDYFQIYQEKACGDNLSHIGGDDFKIIQEYSSTVVGKDFVLTWKHPKECGAYSLCKTRATYGGTDSQYTSFGPFGKISSPPAGSPGEFPMYIECTGTLAIKSWSKLITIVSLTQCQTEFSQKDKMDELKDKYQVFDAYTENGATGTSYSVGDYFGYVIATGCPEPYECKWHGADDEPAKSIFTVGGGGTSFEIDPSMAPLVAGSGPMVVQFGCKDYEESPFVMSPTFTVEIKPKCSTSLKNYQRKQDYELIYQDKGSWKFTEYALNDDKIPSLNTGFITNDATPDCVIGSQLELQCDYLGENGNGLPKMDEQYLIFQGKLVFQKGYKPGYTVKFRVQCPYDSRAQKDGTPDDIQSELYTVTLLSTCDQEPASKDDTKAFAEKYSAEYGETKADIAQTYFTAKDSISCPLRNDFLLLGRQDGTRCYDVENTYVPTNGKKTHPLNKCENPNDVACDMVSLYHPQDSGIYCIDTSVTDFKKTANELQDNIVGASGEKLSNGPTGCMPDSDREPTTQPGKTQLQCKILRGAEETKPFTYRGDCYGVDLSAASEYPWYNGWKPNWDVTYWQFKDTDATQDGFDISNKVPTGNFQTEFLNFENYRAFKSAFPADLVVDRFYVRATGLIRIASNSDSVKLVTECDDGCKLYFDNALVIDDWGMHGPTEKTFTITATNPGWYEIRIEYFENTSTERLTVKQDIGGTKSYLVAYSPYKPYNKLPCEKGYFPCALVQKPNTGTKMNGDYCVADSFNDSPSGDVGKSIYVETGSDPSDEMVVGGIKCNDPTKTRGFTKALDQSEPKPCTKGFFICYLDDYMEGPGNAGLYCVPDSMSDDDSGKYKASLGQFTWYRAGEYKGNTGSMYVDQNEGCSKPSEYVPEDGRIVMPGDKCVPGTFPCQMKETIGRYYMDGEFCISKANAVDPKFTGSYAHEIDSAKYWVDSKIPANPKLAPFSLMPVPLVSLSADGKFTFGTDSPVPAKSEFKITTSVNDHQWYVTDTMSYEQLGGVCDQDILKADTVKATLDLTYSGDPEEKIATNQIGFKSTYGYCPIMCHIHNPETDSNHENDLISYKAGYLSIYIGRARQGLTDFKFKYICSTWKKKFDDYDKTYISDLVTINIKPFCSQDASITTTTPSDIVRNYNGGSGDHSFIVDYGIVSNDPTCGLTCTVDHAQALVDTKDTNAPVISIKDDIKVGQENTKVTVECTNTLGKTSKTEFMYQQNSICKTGFDADSDFTVFKDTTQLTHNQGEALEAGEFDSWTDGYYFEVADIGLKSDAGCPIDKCEILDSDGASYTGDKAYLKGTGIIFKTDNDNQYEETVQVVCKNENSIMSSQTQTVSTGPINIHQASPCVGVLTPKLDIANQLLDYTYTETFTKMAAADLVTTSDTTQCPITKCVVMNQYTSKKADNSNTGGNALELDYFGLMDIRLDGDDHDLYISQNVKAKNGWGYGTEFAVRCFVKDNIEAQTNWFTVYQNEPTCLTDAKASQTIPDMVLDYSHTPNTWTEIASASIVTTTDNINCPITSCVPYVAGYQLMLQNQIKIEQDSVDSTKWIFYMTQNWPTSVGYVIKNVWINCKNDLGDVVRTNTFDVKQTPNPCYLDMQVDQDVGTTTESPFLRLTPFKTINLPISQTDATNCPIEKCELQKKNMRGDWMDFSKNVNIINGVQIAVEMNKVSAGTYTLKFTTDMNQRGGYKVEGLRVQCTNAVTSKTVVRTFDVKQEVNPCLDSINDSSVKLTTQKKLDYPYVATGLLETEDFQKLWTGRYTTESDCALTCSVRNDQCTEGTTGDSAITLKSDNQYQIQFTQNVVEGYNSEVSCIYCANLDDSASFIYSVGQLPRCHLRLSKKSDSPNVKVETILAYRKDTAKDSLGVVIPTWTNLNEDVFGSYFSNENTDGHCPLTQCYTMRPGCVEKADISNVRIIESNGKWVLQAGQDRPLGYKEEVCIACTNGGDSDGKKWPRQTVTWSSHLVSLPSKCNYQMSERIDAPTSFIHNMDVEDNIETSIDIFEKVFLNNDTVNCPNPTCEQIGTYSEMSLSETAPWVLSVKDTIYGGWTPKKATIVCKTEYQVITYNKLVFSQTHRCLESGKLVPKVYKMPNLPIKYSKDATPTQFADWTDLFTNEDPTVDTICNPTSCKAMTSGAVADWNFNTSPGFTMSKTTPFDISYDQSVKYGFTYDVTIRCTNPIMTTVSNLKIVQENKCIRAYETLDKVPFELTEEQKALPVEEQPTKNEFKYEVAFSSSPPDEEGKDKLPQNENLNRTDVGFNGVDHAKNDTYTANETIPVYFTNNELADCGWQECKLMGQGCQFPFTATEHVKMDESAPWTVRAMTNITEGYNTTFCVKCSTASDFITQDDIVFTQKPSTPWMMIGIIVLVVGVIVCTAISGIVSFKKGKATGITMAELGSSQQNPTNKVELQGDNELVDVAPQAKYNAEAFVDEVVLDGTKRDDHVDKDSDAPESIRSASFFHQPQGADTNRAFQEPATVGQ